MRAESAPVPLVAPGDAPAAGPGLPHLEYERLLRCVHCGFCLPTCPTYAELGLESDSPRGRIYLVKALADGRLDLTDSVAEHLSLCLDCRACETACPAGVDYGHIIEAARLLIERERPGSPGRRLLRRVALRTLLPRPGLLRAAARGLRLYQRSGLQRLVRASGLLGLLPAGLRAAEALLPPLPAVARGHLPAVTLARGARRARVAILAGCVQDTVFRADNEATIRCLARNGAEVVVPPGQGCCGALPAHAGDLATAVALARQTIAAFETAGADHIIVNAAGCGAHLKAYGRLLGDDPAWAPRAAAFARSVLDVTEFLARSPLRGPLGPLPVRATYHDPCHLAHGQRIREAPRVLLRQVPGLELVELRESELCCGSAGHYNLTQPEMARRLLSRKLGHLEATGARVVVTANAGCLLQIRAGLRERGLPIEVLHVVGLLDRAYAAAGEGR